MIKWQIEFFSLSKAAAFYWAKALTNAANAAKAKMSSVPKGCAPSESSLRSVSRAVSRYNPDDAPCAAYRMSCTIWSFQI